MASDDQLRFKFTARAEILQVDVSVDINDPRAELVEFLVGINTRGYGFNRDGDVLMHVSWSDRTPSQMDETVTLPSGTEVDAGDFLGISAWMGGEGLGDPIRVSPEVVVLYRWRTARRS